MVLKWFIPAVRYNVHCCWFKMVTVNDNNKGMAAIGKLRLCVFWFNHILGLIAFVTDMDSNSLFLCVYMPGHSLILCNQCVMYLLVLYNVWYT